METWELKLVVEASGGGSQTMILKVCNGVGVGVRVQDGVGVETWELKLLVEASGGG